MRGGRELVLQYLESSMLRAGMGEEARFLFAFPEKKHPFFLLVLLEIHPKCRPPQQDTAPSKCCSLSLLAYSSAS